MRTEKKTTKVTFELDSCICNKCGRSLIIEDSAMVRAERVICGLEAVVFGAYDSPHLEDAHIYEFDLCEKCLMEMFATFKHPVEKEYSGY